MFGTFVVGESCGGRFVQRIAPEEPGSFQLPHHGVTDREQSRRRSDRPAETTAAAPGLRERIGGGAFMGAARRLRKTKRLLDIEARIAEVAHAALRIFF